MYIVLEHLLLPAAKLHRSMDVMWPSSGNIYQILQYTGQRNMGTWVIKVTDFNSEARYDLRGHLEASMAPEATKIMAGRDNVHMDTRVVKIADFKSL